MRDRDVIWPRKSIVRAWRSEIGAAGHGWELARSGFGEGQAVLFRAEDKYSVLYTIDAEHVLDRTIDELARTLDPEVFLRIHRSAIVSVNFVRDLTSVDGGRFLVSLSDTRGTRLQASRSGARTLRDRLGL